MAERRLFGGIELGGTKTVLAIGHGDGQIVSRATLPTTVPDDLIPAIAAFFGDCAGPDALAGVGVGAFGPIVIDPAAADYGRLLATPKPGWSGFDLAGALRSLSPAPPTLVTDVAAAGIGEAWHGALQGHDPGVYLTVGTGIGGAIISRGQVLPALLHPEMGHIPVRRHADDTAASLCRFHEDCVEGLAAGPAIMARFGAALRDFATGSPEQRMIASYIGQLCATLVLALSPRRIILGGGVGKAAGLVTAVHRAMLDRLGDYASHGATGSDYICAPQLGEDAGIIGALICAGRSGEPAAASN